MDAEDLEIIEAFVTESTELLNSLDQDLIALEQTPDNNDLLNRVFRSFHTIKGGANFFKEYPAFAQIGKIAHASEDVMGEIRNGKNHITAEMMDIILKGLETIKQLVAQIRVTQFDSQDYSELVQKLRNFLIGESPKKSTAPTVHATSSPQTSTPPAPQQPAPPAPQQPAPPAPQQPAPPAPQQPATPTQQPATPTQQPATPTQQPAPPAPQQPAPPPSDLSPEDFLEIAQAFLVEAREIMDKLEQNLVELEQNPNNQDLFNAVFRGMHTIKGNANFLSSDANFFKIARIAHATEDLIGAKRQGQLEITPDIMDYVLQATNTIRSLLQSAEQNQQSSLNHEPIVNTLRNILATCIASTTKISTTKSGMQSSSTPPTSSAPTKPSAPIAPVAPSAPATSAPSTPATSTPAGIARSAAPAPPSAPALPSAPAGIAKSSTPTPQSAPTPPTPPTSAPTPTASAPAPATSPTSTSLSDDEDLTKDFLDESRELTKNSENDLAKLEKNPQDQRLLEQVFRSMHTLKSTTAFLGYHKISEIAQYAEEMMSKVSKGMLAFDRQILYTMLEVIEYLNQFFHRLAQGNKDEGNSQEILKKLQQCLTPNKFAMSPQLSFSESGKPVTMALPLQTPTESGKPVTMALPLQTPTESDKPVTMVLPLQTPSSERALSKNLDMATSGTPPPGTPPPSIPGTTPPGAPGPIVESTITIEANRLDSLMNLVGELVLGRNRLSQLVKDLSEKLNDDRLTQDLSGAVDFLDFVTSDLQRAVLKTRMQPVRNIFNRFPNNIRTLARELGKEVKLVTSGAETELDKSVIQPLSESLTHLLRNAVDHGIESPDARRKAGKNPCGTIILTASYEGNYILICVQDDGKGINHEIIKAKAIEKGLLTIESAARLPPKELIDFIFAPGFSTSDKVSNVSGRGVGMDVVKTKVEGLGGSVEINTKIGQGTTFILRIPLTLAIIQALHVQVNTEIYAVPLSSVIETLRLYRGQVETVSGHEVVRFRNTIIPLIRLSDIFDVPNSTSTSDKLYIIVAGIADKQIGIIVDKIVGQEEVVVKSMGKLLENTPGISGACIGGDGRITLIIDLSGIMRLIPFNIGATVAAAKAKTPTKQESSKRESINTILVAEDSRSERKRVRMLLEHKGYRVIEATDGKEALTKLSDYSIDLVITDIEMPELDGYRLSAKIRENPKFKFLPIIAVSTHKEMIDRIKGMEAGINFYLPKPLHEDDLFNAIKSLLS